MTPSNFHLLKVILIVIAFTGFISLSKAQYFILPTITMDAPSPCSGSAHPVTFRAGGVCPGQALGWNIIGPGFVYQSSGSDWIRGFFTSGGPKAVGLYYKGIYTNGTCDNILECFEKTFSIGE